jgi:hypothetical protein
MPDRLDYELRAIEADNRAETTLDATAADHWRSVANGYRLLADFIAHEQAILSDSTHGREFDEVDHSGA